MKIPSRQSGAALMAALMFLVIMTMLGLAAVRATTQQTRMAAGMQFQASAFQAAEAAIRMVLNEVVNSAAQPAAILISAQAAAQTRTPTLSGSTATSVATVSFNSSCPGSVVEGVTLKAGVPCCCFDIEGVGQFGSSNAASVQEQRIYIGAPTLDGVVKS